ncbi:Predicted membrane protein [Mycoplasmopsis citelli]|uniref:Predicted membrane protein n=1 Tax=Mycoplasmopsis citelli TaxID=171281 RepID=A0A449B314_9BACT|nr:GDSL-type esterase/lipase family protein [Mycoplasmopsis citelli]VEU74980.1 Predicted membrane protein [Mycoplasmopsis citelli]
MSKKRNLIIGLSLLSLSSAYVASCNAPGSSAPIQKEDPQIPLTTETVKKQGEAPEIANPDQSLNGNSSNSSSLFSNPVDSNVAKLISKNLIKANEKINYVAFGDSITAGFDGTLPADYQGEKSADGIISGVSYPAFLARLLNTNSRVSEFKNFAHSGATILDWLKFLGVDYPSDNKAQVFKAIYKNEFDKTLKDFKERLSRANLVTFTLGANDFFELVTKNIQDYNLVEIFKTLISSSPSYGELVKFVNDVLGKSLTEINQRINTLIATIKVLAPHANINIISYPTPLLGLKKIFDEYVKSLFGNLPINIQPLDYLIGLLNSGLKNAAKIGSINYINLYNSAYWGEHASEFSSILMDIHPNTLGYKKMAMDLYLKLTTDYFGTQNYGNYDFNKEFLNSDSDTLEFQIQPTQTQEEVLGVSTPAYLGALSTFEKDVNPYRNEKNFGARVADLINVFGDLLSSKGMQDSIYNLQVQLRELKNKGELTLNKVPTILISSFLNETNIVKVLSVIADSEILKENKERVTELFNTLLFNGLSTYKEQIVDFLGAEIAKVTQNKLKEDSVKSIVNNILSDQNFATLLKNILTIFINHSENFKNVATYKDLLLGFLSNQEDFENLSDSLSSIAGYILETPDIQELFADIFYSFLVDNKLNENILSDQTTKFTKDLLSFASNSLVKDNLLKDIIKEILDHLRSNPNTDLNSALKSAFGNVFSSLFKFDDNNTKLVSLLKNLFNSKVISDNKNLIKQLISNLLNSKQGWISSLVNILLPKNVSAELNNYGGSENVKLLIKYIFSLDKTKETINEVLGALVDHSTEFSNFNSFDELLQKVLSALNLDDIKDNLNSIIQSVLSSSEVAKIGNNLLLNALGKLGLDTSDIKVFKFASDVSSSLKSLVDYLGITDQIIDTIFAKIKQAQASSDHSIEILSSIPAEIFKIISERLSKDTFSFVKGLLKLPLVNSDNFKIVFVQVIDKLWDKWNPANFISKPLISFLLPQLNKSPLSDYLDKNEITNFIYQLVKTNSFKEVILNSISFIIQNPIWDTNINSFKDLVLGLLQDKTLKNIFKDSLSKLIDDTLDTISLQKSFAKTINTLLKPYSVSLEAQKLETLGKEFASFLKEILNKNNLKENLLDAIFNVLSTAKNFQDIPLTLKDLILQALDLENSPLFISSILGSQLVASQKENLKNLFEELLNKLKDSDQKGSLLRDIGFNNLVTQNLLTAEEVNNLAEFFFSNDTLTNVIKKLFNHVVDNSADLASATNYNDFIDNLAYKQDFVLELKQPLKDLLNTHLNSNLVKNIVSKSLHRFLITQSIDNNLTQEQTDKVVSDLVSFVQGNTLITTFINHFIDNFVDNAYNGGLSHFEESISRSLNLAFENTFDFLGQAGYDKLVELINNLTSSQLLNDNKEYFKTLLNNIIDKLPQLNAGSLVLKLLPQTPQIFIENSITAEKFNSLVNLILSLDESKAILKSVVNSLLDSYQSLQNATSLNDLVSKFFKVINFSDIKNNAKKLLTTLIEQPDFKPLLKNIFNELYKYLKLNPEESYNVEFIDGLSNNFKETIDQFNLFDPIVDKIFEKLTQASQNNQPLEILKALPADLGTIIGDQVTKNPKDFINKVFNLSLFVNNKQALSDLLKAIYGILGQNNVFDDLIKNKVIPLLMEDQASKFVDAEEIGDLLLNTFRSDNFQNFFYGAIELLTHNQDWVNHLNTPKELINSILAIPSFTDKIQQHIKPLVKEVIQKNKLTLTLTKLVYKWALENGFNFDANDIGVVTKNALSSIIPYLENIGTLDVIINKLFELIQKHKNVDLIISNLANELVSTFDFSRFDLIKHLLGSDLFTKDQDILKDFLVSFVEEFTTKDLYTQLVDKFSLNSTFSTLNLTQDQVDGLNSFAQELLKDNHLFDLIKKAIPYLVDNAQNLSQANSYSQLLLKLFKNEALISLIENPFIELAKKGLQNSNVQNLLGILLSQTVNNSKYSWVFNGVEKLHDLFTDIFGLFSQGQSEFSVLEKVYQGVLEFAKDQNATSLNDFVNKIITHFNTLFSEENVLKLVHLSANLFPKNEAKINKIIENIFNKIKDDSNFISDLISFIPAEIQDKINPYISRENLNYLTQKIFSLPKFKEFVLSTFTSIFSDKDKITQTSSFKDLLKLLLSKADFANKAKLAFKEFVQLLKSDTKLKEIAKFALTNLIDESSENLNKDQISQFSSDLVNLGFDLLNTLGIYETGVDALFNSLSTLSKSANPQFNLALFNPLVDVAINEFNKDNQSFIKSITSSQIWTNNKDVISEVLLLFAKKLISNGTITKIINQEIEAIPDPYAKYFDKEAIKALVNEILQAENVYKLVEFVIHYLVNNTSWTDHLNDYEILTLNFIKDSNILTAQKTNLSNLINKILDSNNTTHVILKTVNTLLKEQGYTQDITSELALGIKDFAQEFNQKDPQNTIIDKLITLLDKKVKSGNSFDQVFEGFKNDLVSTLELSDFKLAKALIDSILFKNTNKESAKSVLKFLFEKYYNNTNIAKIVDLVPLNSISQVLGDSVDHLKTLLNNILNNDNFKQAANKVIDFVIDHIEDFENASSYNDLVKIAFGQSQFTTSLKDHAVALLNVLVKDSQSRSVISNLITKELNKPEAERFLNGVSDKTTLVNNLLELFDVFDTQLGISSVIYESLVDFFKDNGIDFSNIGGLIASIFDGIKNSFAVDTENKIASIIRNISNSKLLTQNY